MLNDAAIERFARQIVVPGVGADGQERICSSRILIIGEPDGVVLARAYACAAGFTVCTGELQTPGCVLIAGTRLLGSQSLDALRALGAPILWYRLDTAALVTGTVAVGEPLDDLLLYTRAPSGNETQHALAAADLVAAAVGLVLGWTDVDPAYRLQFG